MRVEAVAREPSPRWMSAEMRLSSGGCGGAWVVARRTARRRVGFDSRDALESDALSLMRPKRSLKLIVLPMEDMI